MADDLDDCWWENKKDVVNTDAPAELQVLTDDEQSNDGSSSPSLEDGRSSDDVTSPVIDKSSPPAKETKKRKSTNPDEPKKKKQKVKRKKISEALAKITPEPAIPLDLMSALDKHYDGKLSTVEMDDLKFSEEGFVASAGVSDTPSDYLHTVMTVPKWKKKVKAMEKSPGAPLLLVVCSAAIRAVDVIRDMKRFHGSDCKSAKLFAKHLKVAQQTKFLKKTVIHVGVGTPNRIMALLDNESLSLKQTTLVMFDWSWRDTKLRRLVDIKDIKDDLFKLLQKYLVPSVKAKKTRFALL